MLVDNSIVMQAYRLSPDGQSITWRILHTPVPSSPGRLRFLRTGASSVPERAHSHGPLLVSLLPRLPAGPWVTADLVCVSSDPRTARLAFAAGHPLPATAPLPEVSHRWSPSVLDARHLRLLDRSRESAGVCVVQAPGRQLPLHYRFATFPEDVPAVDRETQVLQRLDGRGLTPEFVGHVCEGGMVMGYVLEEVGERPVDAVHDLEKCRAVLAELHEAGVKLGGASLNKFAKLDDGKIVVVDLSGASLTEDASELKEETL